MKSLAVLQEHFSDDRKANDTSLHEYKDAKKYYHGAQLSSDVLSVLKSRGQPVSYENLYKMIVDKILGYKMQSIQEIKVSGRQEQDKALANLLGDIIKVFSQDYAYNKEIAKRDFELILGMAVVELWIENDENGDKHISIKTLAGHCFIIDKFSTDLNALDARRFHKKINMDYDEAHALFGDRVAKKYDKIGGSRVEIIESWYKEKEGWNRYIWQEDNQVIAHEITPFRDKSHPFIISKFYIDHKNRWYGMFRDIKPLQDFINFTENKITNMMGSMKAFFEESAVLDPVEFSRNASIDNAIIKVRDGALKENKIHFVQHHNDIAALSQKVGEKRNMLKIISGLNEEALGMAVNRQSGTAIAQRRDAGLMGLMIYLKRGDDMDRLIFEKALSWIQHYFTKAQTFRIVDKKVGERYFGINENPQNAIKIGAFDLILKSTPKIEGREERFVHWAEMMKTIANIRPDLVTDLLPLMLKDTDSPIVADIEELLALKAKQAEEQAQAQAQAQQQEAQIAQQQIAADIAETQAKAQKYQAQAQIANIQAQNIALNTQYQQSNQSLRGALKGGNAAQNSLNAQVPRANSDFLQDSKKK